MGGELEKQAYWFRGASASVTFVPGFGSGLPVASLCFARSGAIATDCVVLAGLGKERLSGLGVTVFDWNVDSLAISSCRLVLISDIVVFAT